MLFAALGTLVGVLVGRWLALLLAVAAVVVLGARDSVLSGNLHWWISIVTGAFVALGIAIGVGARRVAQRAASRR